MRVLVQRSNQAKVSVDGKMIAQIKSGLVLLVGFMDGDCEEDVEWMVHKIVHLRIFPDENHVMNQSILEYGGDILSVSQFTLYADTTKGNRPSYKRAMRGKDSEKLYLLFNQKLSAYTKVETGIFGADMLVEISNVGPTTILLEREKNEEK